MTARAKLAINNTFLFLWRPGPIFNCSLHNIGIISIGKSRRDSPLVKYALLSLVHCPSLSHYSSLYCSTKAIVVQDFPCLSKEQLSFHALKGRGHNRMASEGYARQPKTASKRQWRLQTDFLLSIMASRQCSVTMGLRGYTVMELRCQFDRITILQI